MESIEPLPFDQDDGKIDLAAFSGVDVNDFELFNKSDDLQDEYNDIWGLNDDTGDSLQDQRPRKRESTSNNFVMHAVSGGGVAAEHTPIL